VGSIKQIDIDGVRERLECDDDFLAEIWDAFREEARKLETELTAAIETGDLYAVEFRAHSLKGMSANIGAHRLMSVASDMERAARSKDSEAVRGKYPELAASIRSVIKEIDELIQ